METEQKLKRSSKAEARRTGAKLLMKPCENKNRNKNRNINTSSEVKKLNTETEYTN